MISSLEDYKKQVAEPTESISVVKNSLAVVVGRHYSTFYAAPPAGAIAPTSARTCNRLTNSALGQKNASAGKNLRILGLEMAMGQPGTILICDRLADNGGMSGIVVGASTTNLPTPALTRYTSGEGVMIGVEIIGAVGATATTMSIGYTNQAGVAGRVTPLTPFGGTGFNAPARFLMFPTQQGDTGARSIESTALTISTGTVGNYGVCLFKPLLMVPNQGPVVQVLDALLGMMCQFEPVLEDACLFAVVLPQLTATGPVFLNYAFAED